MYCQTIGNVMVLEVANLFGKQSFGSSTTVSDINVSGNLYVAGTFELDTVVSLPVPNNYYASAQGVPIGGFYRSQFDGSSTPSTFAITSNFAVAGTTLTVTATAGTLEVGMILDGGSVTSGTYITGQLTGTAGGTGTYTVNNPQAMGVAPTAVLFSAENPDILYVRTA
jgi:hypothetical protein